MEEIADAFGGLVRAVVPLYETEVRGVKMLERVASVLLVPPQVTM
jgi:anion-transporting  ArsA/GET3 family ATPase